jgi:hypothetical protein
MQGSGGFDPGKRNLLHTSTLAQITGIGLSPFLPLYFDKITNLLPLYFTQFAQLFP